MDESKLTASTGIDGRMRRHSYSCRRATIACAPIGPSTSVQLSDIGDWTAEETTGWAAAMWPAGTLRRVRSWIAASTPQGLAALPSWLRIEGIPVPRMSLWPISGALALRRPQGARCSVGEVCTDDSISCASEHSKDLHCVAGGDDRALWTPESKCTVVVVAEEVPLESARRQRPLMSVFQVPAYMVEDYILDKYRPLCFSYTECLKSWGYVHSELGNIMTHLAGVLVFVVLALITGPWLLPHISRSRPEGAPAIGIADYAVVYVYLIAVLFCLAASVAFHTLSCHSQHKHFRSLRCDFIGILTLIVGSFVPVGYFGFLHSSSILIGYMAMFVAIGVAGVAVSVWGKVEDPRRAGWRPIIFFTIAITGLVPIIHGTVVNGYKGAVDQMSLWYVVGMGIMYIAGTMIYAFKIPERYRPGKHDVCMSSHQIFHVFVVLAAVCHYIGIVRALAWSHK